MADPQESLELKTPGGFMAKATGANLLAVVMVIAICLTAWMVVEHRVESKEQLKAYAAEHEKTLTRVAEAIEKSTEAQEVTNYIFSLSPEERQRLRLDMPESLRRRAR